MLPTRFASLAVACSLLFAAAPAARADIPSGAAVDGIRCDTMEGAVLHIHQHVAIRDHGKPIDIPQDVGRPLVAGCFYWIHTHTPDGIIHVESPTFHTFTLGNFFDIWGEPLTRGNVAGAKPRAHERVAVWVDGRRYAGDPRAIELTQHLDIAIEVGPPYTQPKPFTQWNGQ